MNHPNKSARLERLRSFTNPERVCIEEFEEGPREEREDLVGHSMFQEANKGCAQEQYNHAESERGEYNYVRFGTKSIFENAPEITENHFC